MNFDIIYYSKIVSEEFMVYYLVKILQYSTLKSLVTKKK